MPIQKVHSEIILFCKEVANCVYTLIGCSKGQIIRETRLDVEYFKSLVPCTLFIR